MIRQPDGEVDIWARATIGAAIEVHRLLGPGLLESLYEEALCTEMELRGVPYARQVPVPVTYKGREIGHGRLDILVAGELIVELKTVDALAPIHLAQLLSYLRATGHHLGLLINFNVAVLRNGGIKRVVHTAQRTLIPVKTDQSDGQP
jgi:GxxExxY protein